MTFWQIPIQYYGMRKKRAKRLKLSEQVRSAIEHCGVSRYVIARDTGISNSTLSRFMSGERGLTMTALDTLAEHLELNLVRGGKPFDPKDD